MPWTLGQHFFSGRGASKLEERTISDGISRSRSKSAVFRRGKSKTQEVMVHQTNPESILTKSTPSPLRRLATLNSGRRSFLERQTRKLDEISDYERLPQHEIVKDSTERLPAIERKERQSSLRKLVIRWKSASFRNSISSNSKDSNTFSRRAVGSPQKPLRGGRFAMGRLSSNGSALNGTRDDENNPASVETFVRKCADCFDSSGRCSDEHFLRILCITHPWFMTSEQLMVLFTKLYEEEKGASGYSTKVFYTIRFWINEFPHMFDLDQNLVKALRNLQNICNNDPNVDKSLIDLEKKHSYKWMSATQMSVRFNYVDRKQRKVSLIFNHLEPEDIAIHMSFLEYNSFRRLTLSDFHKYAANGVIKDNLKLERAVFLFNNITHWVQCMVLDHHKPSERAQAIVKFVEVAKKLRSMQNFNTLMAIVGALTHTTISRLKKTMAEVPKSTQKALDEFVELLDSKSNYRCYRRVYKEVTENFKIPVIGILMKDFTALHAALPDRVGDGLINVRKMMNIGTKFEEIFRSQQVQFPYDVNKDLVNTLRVSLYLYYNEEEIYQLSVSREPRDIKYSASGLTSSPTKTTNMGFAEFASFTCQLDDELIKRHVKDMTGSVFKAYDQNGDGYISESEFACFIKNFPGLDSFATVDKDNDGRISMTEMVDYFLKISSARRNQVCQSFKHDFAEATYFHPTFCEECDKLLWGLVKQGWKCKDCGINCHKHCKDRIVQECRPKTELKNLTSSSHSKKRDKRKEKHSLSSESDLSVNGDIPRSPALHDDDAFEAGDSKQGLKSKLLTPNNITSTKPTQHPFGKRRVKTTSVPTHSASPEASGRRFRPFQLLLRKSSPKLVDRNLGSPLSVPNHSAASSKIIYKKAKSCEDISDLKTVVEVGRDDEKAAAKKDAEATKKSSNTLSPDPLTNTKFNFATDPNSRHDSGISSSCSCFVTLSTSFPTTPLCSEHAGRELRFQYPPAAGDTANDEPKIQVPQNASSSVEEKPLFEQNKELRRENQELRLKLQRANDVIKELENKLVKLKSTD